MESLNPELALYGSNILCTKTDIVLFKVSEVRPGTVCFLNRSGFRMYFLTGYVIFLYLDRPLKAAEEEIQ